MRSPTHIIGGVSITGIAAAFCGENILSTKTNILCVVFFSLLPDIDNPQSPIGRMFPPISRFFCRKYGHRTITHSLAALIVVCAFVFGLQKIFDVTGFNWFRLSALICGIAYFSHLWLDMMTFQGVPLMYPNREEWHFPDNPKYQFKTGGNGEFIVAGCLLSLGAFSAPLMEGGFWTVYNRSFGTPKTLYSEFIKSQDLLEVTYKIQKGSAVDTGRGFVLDAETKDKFTLMRNDSIFHFDATQQIFKEVIPTHTGRKFYVEEKRFIGIDSDSLNRLVQNQIIVNIEADANAPFYVTASGVPSKTLSAKYRFPNRISFRSLDSLPQKDELFQETDFASMAIRNDLQRLDDEYKFRLKEFERHVDSIKIYEKLILSTSEPLSKERFQRRLQGLKLEEKPQFDEVSRTALNAALRISEARFIAENKRREFEREKAYLAEIRTKQKTQFVGFVKTIRIE